MANTREASCCGATLQEALARPGPPEIYKNDPGSHCTSVDVTDGLTEAGLRISMDDTGGWMDTVFIERLWQSLKYECVSRSECATGSRSKRSCGSSERGSVPDFFNSLISFWDSRSLDWHWLGGIREIVADGDTSGSRTGANS